MSTKDYLDIAYIYATKNSGCNKVAVGSAIVKDNRIIALGANKTHPYSCKDACGCLRVQKYGNDSKAHRDPADCRAIHSEIDAICSAAYNGVPISDSSIYVTRYPCEGCARAIVAAGIKKVFYGGTAKVSQDTEDILGNAGISLFFIEDWREDNTDR